MHLDEGELRSALDRELAPAAAEHLAACEECRRRADEIAAQSRRVEAHLGRLASQPSPAVSPQAAFAHWQARRPYERKETTMLGQIFKKKYRPAWAFAAVVVIFAASMALPPVRAWAQGVLAQFRVSKISVVSIDSSVFKNLGSGSDLSKQISQLLSDSMTVTKKPGAPRPAASAAQASALAGFQVRLPTSRTDTPQLVVQDGMAFQLVVNRARTQALLDSAGASNLQLPASIDGAAIKVSIPAGVAAGYGECPNLTQEEQALGDKTLPSELAETQPTPNAKGSPGRTMINCVGLTQIPSPTVDAPPDLAIQRLAELGLQFTGMTADQAHQYAQTVDWTSTLVIPIPRNAAQYKPVTVDGTAGYLIQRPLDDAPQYAIIWVKNGIIYAVAGQGNDTAGALAVANSLK